MTSQRRTIGDGWGILAAVMVLLAGLGAGTEAPVQDASPRAETWQCPPCGCASDGQTFEAAGACPSCGMAMVATSSLGKTITPRNVAIVIWDGAELLDFAGPTEVFSAARSGGQHLFNVYTVAATTDPIVSQGVVTIVPQYSIADCPQPDIFVLPGGGTNSPLNNPEMIEWVRHSAAQADVAMSVCTGAFVLLKAGLLEGKEATTWHGAIGRLREAATNTVVHDDQRWVDNGAVLTTAGVSAGIDGALHLVARLHGDQAARDTARYMEYDWRPKEVTGRIVRAP